jgi:hypothetical protein
MPLTAHPRTANPGDEVVLTPEGSMHGGVFELRATDGSVICWLLAGRGEQPPRTLDEKPDGLGIGLGGPATIALPANLHAGQYVIATTYAPPEEVVEIEVT